MKCFYSISVALVVVLSGCSVKRNHFFSRQYHQFTTRYNVYFNGKHALRAGEKKMEDKHKEDYTGLLPVFFSADKDTRASSAADMEYAAAKAVKAIEKHSITAKPRRRKNKDSKRYQTFRKKKEFNNQLDKCYLLLGKAYFYRGKYTQASHTFRFIQRQYAGDEKIMAETAVWMFRTLTEQGRFEEAGRWMKSLEGMKLNRKLGEIAAAARTDYYLRQERFAEAVLEAEKLINATRSLKRKPRYYFILAQLCQTMDRENEAMTAFKKSVRFNFDYEMTFQARINMALALREGDRETERKLNKMLRDSRNEEFRDRIYYALGVLEERKGDEAQAVDMFWKSVRASVGNDRQEGLSFLKLGDYYFKERDYINACHCYDSCLYAMNAEDKGYFELQARLADLTALTACLNTIRLQDSLIRLAALPEAERKRLAEEKKQEARQRENEGLAGIPSTPGTSDAAGWRTASFRNRQGGEWYFYNPVTRAAGKNEFNRRWGRRKLEDHWRRHNKSVVEFTDSQKLLVHEENAVAATNAGQREADLNDLPLTEEKRRRCEQKIEEALYEAGELYRYKLEDSEKACECFEAYIRRFQEAKRLPLVYYMASKTAAEAGDAGKAAEFKRVLKERFPDSDFAKGIDDEAYFRKMEQVRGMVEEQYRQAFDLYRNVYYREAEERCDRILAEYPENHVKANVLFLKAMCVLNTREAEEGKKALEEVLENSPSQAIEAEVKNILRLMATGEKPVIYSSGDMAESRQLRRERNWNFSREVDGENRMEYRTTYQEAPEMEQRVVFLLPETMTAAEKKRFGSRLNFIHEDEATEGKRYRLMEQDAIADRKAVWIEKFGQVGEALEYLKRISADRYLLKIIGDRDYRMFSIDSANLALLERLKDVERYVDFFAEHYFADRREGEIIAGREGTAAHLFSEGEKQMHHFVLAVPSRDVNARRIAESLRPVSPGLPVAKENYDAYTALIVVKNVGDKAQALAYLKEVLKNKEVFDRLAGLDYDAFVVHDPNLKVLRDNECLKEYIQFFNNRYLKEAGAVGVASGDYIYNNSVAHRFVLILPDEEAGAKLKPVFEEFNFAGLSFGEEPYGSSRALVISGFSTKEEAMRYFNRVSGDRKWLKALRNVDYMHFVISEVNWRTLSEKKNLEDYLEFFKKYYMNDK